METIEVFTFSCERESILFRNPDNADFRLYRYGFFLGSLRYHKRLQPAPHILRVSSPKELLVGKPHQLHNVVCMVESQQQAFGRKKRL